MDHIGTTSKTSIACERGTIWLCKNRNVVVLNFDGNCSQIDSLTSWNNRVLCTLPEGYRPIDTYHTSLFWDNHGNTTHSAEYYIKLTSNGNVSLVTRGVAFETTTYNYGLWFSATFITAD